MNAFESLEHHHRTRDRCEKIANVELHYFVAGAGAGVLHGTRHGCGAGWRHLGGRDREIRILECRIAEAKTEREQWLAGEIEVVVAAASRLVVVDERQLAF